MYLSIPIAVSKQKFCGNENQVSIKLVSHVTIHILYTYN